MESFQYDDHVNGPASIDLVQTGTGTDVLVNGEPFLSADADQWGTWYTLMPIAETVAQEFGTRSFLSAMIMALEKLREACEYDTKDATKQPPPAGELAPPARS